MSTNHTPNYGLSQWECSDKVLMDDFNADNAKIDAALFNHPSAELIAAVTVEKENRRLKLDISQINWSRYMALLLHVESSLPGGYRITMHTEDEVSANIHNTLTTIGGNSDLISCYAASKAFTIFPVLYDSNHTALALAFGYGQKDYNLASLSAGGGRTPLNQCGELEVYRDSGTFAVGDRAVLWGVK